MVSDGNLVQRVAQGDAHAFETLHARYSEAVRRHLTRMMRDAHAADDVAQEAFLSVWTRAGQWNGKGSVRAWLFRIATNRALNHLRSVRRRRQEPLSHSAPTAGADEESAAPGWLVDASSLGPDAVAEQVERRSLLNRLVDDLPESKREVVRLVYDAQMDLQEVSDALGIPEGTVKSRLHHARKRLARDWRRETAHEWQRETREEEST